MALSPIAGGATVPVSAKAEGIDRALTDAAKTKMADFRVLKNALDMGISEKNTRAFYAIFSGMKVSPSCRKGEFAFLLSGGSGYFIRGGFTSDAV